MSLIKIVMIAAADAGVGAEELRACAAALTKQTQNHFALPPPHGYGVGASVRVAASTFDAKKDEYVLLLLRDADQEGALGYHDQTAYGNPVMKIFPLLDKQDGSAWQVTASHEVLETLADPNCARCAQSYDGRIWAYEVCDAVERDSYLIDGVPMSNFVLPPYFEPVTNKVKYDHMGLIKRPLEIRDGGYGQWFDSMRGWNMVEGGMRRAARRTIHGRSARRADRFFNHMDPRAALISAAGIQAAPSAAPPRPAGLLGAPVATSSSPKRRR